MAVTTTETHDHDDHGHGESSAPGAENPGGHHESAFARDQKERLMLWLFIGGDLVFLLLEVFAWFYLRTLNTHGLWNAAACTTAKPCTDGLGNPITAPVARASIVHPLIIAGLVIVSALLVWAAERAAAQGKERGAIAAPAGLALVCMLGAIGLQIYQFQILPFTTIDGSYASVYEYFMGSTLAHLILMAFILIGLWNRARKGRYAGKTWYRIRLIRFFAVWIAVSTAVLVIVASFFA